MSKTLLVGFGGCSASGKSTNSNLIIDLLTPRARGSPAVLLMHQDYFFKPDSLIPNTNYTYSNGNNNEKEVAVECANWDCVDALDLKAFNAHLLSLKSDSDKSSTKVTPVSVNRPAVETDILLALKSNPDVQILVEDILSIIESKNIKLILVDGFLLYSMQDTSSLLDLPLFFHAPLQVLLERRAARTDYKTIEGVWKDPPHYFQKVVWSEYLKNNRMVLDDATCSQNIVKLCTDPSVSTSLQVVMQILEHILEKVKRE